MEAVLFVALLGGFGALMWWGHQDRKRRRAAATTVELVVDDWGVRRRLADGRHEEVAWSELVEVRAVVLPRGPWGDRIRFVLDGGGERGCIVPSSPAESAGLFPALARLRGFDHAALNAVLDGQRSGSTQLWSRRG